MSLSDKSHKLLYAKQNGAKTEYTEFNAEYCQNKDDGNIHIATSGGTHLAYYAQHFHIGPANVELLTVKLDQVLAFLQNDRTGHAQLVFQNCRGMFKQFTQTELVAAEAIIVQGSDIEKYILGPMISPVTSQDSAFIEILHR